MIRAIERYFLLVALSLSLLALGYPGLFTGFRAYIPQLLGLVMFGMGLTLEFKDFQGIWQKKSLVGIGVLLQFLLMPTLGWGLATLCQLPRDEFVGLVMVGACPGGTASNVITYLARANVPLSVVLTLTTTLLAPLLTPLLIYALARTKIDLALGPLMGSVFWIVLFPLLDGLILRRLLRRRLEPILAIFPAISILLIALIIATVVGQNQAQILQLPLMVILAVVLHNGLGLLLGYWGARLFQMPEADCRTVAIEVGMQNSGLGVALATQFVNATAALPAAIFSLWHNISGITLANYWAGQQDRHLQSQDGD
ncbi:bile acid:sodium symporter family protein [Thermosynechococcaceae cyanobacterium BACA0444]|uniref:Bile acid:sodium symporter family protein n=1 Tax=Pseudocalidococcus azoricus BACA0444 TaxID=2918990 RepID=A0AAE4JXW7_9CYAN|nr:bile acid:sodium symporter family protein [Pseudocalidococcus azoricus]MDS3861478.1 bile acid:sodium symporter family protein [Pseudocalidococcus azoricus BACA0444]